MPSSVSTTPRSCRSITRPSTAADRARGSPRTASYLYAIRIFSDADDSFNLCPADICQVPEEAVAASEQLPRAGTRRRSRMRIEAATPPDWVVDARAAHLSALRRSTSAASSTWRARATAEIYLYDVNALSNFVTDAPRLVGFDPFARFADYLERRAYGAVGQEPVGRRALSPCRNARYGATGGARSERPRCRAQPASSTFGGPSAAGCGERQPGPEGEEQGDDRAAEGEHVGVA